DTVRLGAGLAAFLLRGLEESQDLSAANAFPFPHVDANQIPFEPRANVDALDWAQIPGDGDALFDGLAPNRRDIARREGDRRRDAARSPSAGTLAAIGRAGAGTSRTATERSLIRRTSLGR